MTEEFLDILNPDGTPNGKRAAKSDIHRQGLWHRTAHCWIVTPDGQLLLQRRGPTKDTHPNCWDISSAGHVSAGETSRQSAVREIEEETGLDVNATALEYLFTVHDEGVFRGGAYINREYQDVFLITMPIDVATLRMPEREVTEFQLLPWLTLQLRVEANDPQYVPHPDEYAQLFPILSQRFPHADAS